MLLSGGATIRATSRSWAEVVCRSSLPAAVMQRSCPTCCEEFDVNASLDSRFQCQFAFLRLELARLAADRIEEVSQPLCEHVARLKLLLACITDSYASGGKELTLVEASLPLDPLCRSHL
jgi:hypothetical protein